MHRTSREPKSSIIKYPCNNLYNIDKNPGCGINMTGNSKISIKG